MAEPAVVALALLASADPDFTPFEPFVGSTPEAAVDSLADRSPEPQPAIDDAVRTKTAKVPLKYHLHIEGYPGVSVLTKKKEMPNFNHLSLCR